jgi:hypothetical protein
MALLPKMLFLKGNELYDKYKETNIDNLTDSFINDYNELINQLLDYTRNYLTTDKIAKYILNKSKFENVSNILFLSQDIRPDYLRCLTLHGFKKLLGSKCHDYPKIPHIYKSENLDYSRFYGKGITYTNLLDDSLHNNILDHTIEEDIKNKYYDIVIYGSYYRGMPYYEYFIVRGR